MGWSNSQHGSISHQREAHIIKVEAVLIWISVCDRLADYRSEATEMLPGSVIVRVSIAQEVAIQCLLPTMETGITVD